LSGMHTPLQKNRKLKLSQPFAVLSMILLAT